MNYLLVAFTGCIFIGIDSFSIFLYNFQFRGFPFFLFNERVITKDSSY